MMAHYDDEALVALVDAASEGDPHLLECAECRDSLDQYRAVTSCLGREAVWDLRVLKEEPVPQTIANLRAFADRMRGEDETALPLVADLLSGPREQWMPRLLADARYRTAGVVRKLMEASDKAIDVMPPDALEISALATEIADNLDPAAYPSDTVMKLRGNAWAERGFAIYYSGDLRAALCAIRRAHSSFESVNISDFETARARLAESLIYRGLDQLDTAAALAAEAMPTFVAAGDEPRCDAVRAVDAAIAFRAGNHRRALAIWKDLETTEADDVKRVGLLQNIALCSRELADYETAFSCYGRALEIARRSGAQVAVLVRLRWSVAKMLTLQHRYVESLSILRSVASEFSGLGMREEAVLASLDISELLMIRNDHEGAVAICRDIIRELSAASLEHTSRALTAVAYLKESILNQSASSALVDHVRDYIGRVRTQPALLFAPPPDWHR